MHDLQYLLQYVFSEVTRYKVSLKLEKNTIGKKENYFSIMYCFKSCCEIKLPFNVKPRVSFSSLGDNSHK